MGGGKGRGKRGGRRDDVGDFFTWAKDPNTEDGSRPPPRDRSRSPRRGGGCDEGGPGSGKQLADFISWARTKTEAKGEPPEDDDDGPGGINTFMEWATRSPSPDSKAKAEVKEETSKYETKTARHMQYETSRDLA